MTVHTLLASTVIAALTAGISPADEGLKWQTDLESAQRQARESGRLVLIHFGGPWCEPCQQLERHVFSQPGFGRDLAARYAAVKVDPRQHPELQEKYGVHAVPTDVVTTARGQLVMKVQSPATAAAYSETMNRIADSVQPTATQVVAASAAKDSGTAPVTPHGQLDRYAEYYNRRKPVPPPSDAAPAAAKADEPRGNVAAAPSPAPTTTANAAAYASKPAPRELHDDLARLRQGTDAKANTEKPQANGPPPIALDGYCAVTLVDKRRWLTGDKRWGAIHRGRTYLFANQEAQKAFLAAPDRYTPVFAGNDPVMRVDYHREVPGKREHGAFYNNRVYLFTSEDTYRRFDRDPARYTFEALRQAQRR